MKNNKLLQDLRSNNNGFTLVELAIVIVIIGLLVSGVLVGNALVNATKINKVVMEFKGFETAIITYKAKYKFLPGDDPNAFQNLGSACGSAGLYNNNGDADGQITYGGAPNEDLKAWCHLSQAKLIKGSYPGNYEVVNGSNVYMANVTAPQSAFEGTAYFLGSTLVAPGGSDILVYAKSGNRLALSGLWVANDITKGSLRPEDAKNVDTKLDDGYPHTGKLLTVAGGGQSGCVVSNEYAISTDNNICRPNYFFSD